MAKTNIEWTEETWNPVTGCTPVSAGCEHCYARRMATRLAGRCGYPKDEPFAITLHPDRLTQPLRWRKPRTVFVCSMGDLFHERVPSEFIDQVFAVMAACPQHTFQVLTKRPERMRDLLVHEDVLCDISRAASNMAQHELISEDRYDAIDEALRGDSSIWPPPNVWLGVSVEDQQTADERIPLLLQCPAALRFVSCEPLLGPVRLQRQLGFEYRHRHKDGSWFKPIPGSYPVRLLDWLIVGGETGPGARPMHPQWARSIRDQCQAAGVPFFFKQWGEWLHGSQVPPVSPDPQQWTRGQLVHWLPSGLITIAPRQTEHLPTQIVDEDEQHVGQVVRVYRVGRKRAGRLLDGQLHEAMPEVAK